MAGINPLEIATVEGFGRRVEGYAVWRVPCMTQSGAQALYAKVVDSRRLLVELFCAEIGRALGLPIPKPYVVYARARTISPVYPPDDVLMFGARDESHPSLSMFTRDQDQVVSILRKWVKVRDAGAFDSLIANEDRTSDNILYGAAEHAIWLIDHEDAMRETVGPADVTKNDIFDLLLPGLVEIQRQGLLREAQKLAYEAQQLPIQRLADDPVLNIVQEAQHHARGLIVFLANRRSALPEILRQQIKPKQQTLNFSDQTSHSIGGNKAPL